MIQRVKTTINVARRVIEAHFLKIVIGLSVSSLLVIFTPYTTKGKRFFEEGQDLTSLSIALLPVALTAFLSIRKINKNLAFALLLPVVYFQIQFSANYFFGNWYATDPNLGMYLQYLNTIALLLLAIFLVLSTDKKETWTSYKLNGSVVATAIAITYVIGTWMNWERKIFTITKNDFTWVENGKQEFTQDCCHMFSSPDSWHSQFLDAFQLFGIFAIIYLFFYFLSQFEIGMGLISLGLILSTYPLTWLLLKHSEVMDPIEHGYTESQVSTMGIVMRAESLPGVWIALIASSAFIFMGLYLVGKSKIRNGDAN